MISPLPVTASITGAVQTGSTSMPAFSTASWEVNWMRRSCNLHLLLFSGRSAKSSADFALARSAAVICGRVVFGDLRVTQGALVDAVLLAPAEGFRPGQQGGVTLDALRLRDAVFAAPIVFFVVGLARQG